MISVYLANTRTTQIKIKIECSFSQRIRGTSACLKRLWTEFFLCILTSVTSHQENQDLVMVLNAKT